MMRWSFNLKAPWKIKMDIVWEIVIRENAHATVHLWTINQFLKLVYFNFLPSYYEEDMIVRMIVNNSQILILLKL